MPTSPVVAMTLPFGEASATLSLFDPESSYLLAFEPTPSVLSIDDYRDSATSQIKELLDEAIEVACDLGVEVRRRRLRGVGGGHYWRRGRLRVILDRDAKQQQQLATLADALRGDYRLAEIELSRELAEYFDVRRAA